MRNPRPYDTCRNVPHCKLKYGGSECTCPIPVEKRVPTNIPIKNTNQINQLKVVTETAEVDPKTKTKTWKNPVVVYLRPGEYTDIWVAESRRTTVQEMPT